ncbi:hypothetical protein H8711_00525 [Clostridiaceae bacterium NSJ-31]|uniref:Uncharacterized protein n=1 Tax=Ligaoa zhengdingensis TaxID=2763658 RepID=A0A926I3R8_9FIRM|nr:hypothetical protein [Ligaoa zhengdingensis]MBC8545421.1 hypothetical protein [Ligaoa zhengdingensis]
MDVKKKIIAELDDRIRRLDEHRSCCTEPTENQYDELNQALSRVIGASLYHELEDIRGFVEKL